MKTIFARLTIVFLAITTCLATASPALAANEAWLRLSADTFDTKVNQEFTVDVLIEGAPEVYGVDVQLGFDPAVLQVIDANESVDGVQLAAGSFFDTEQSFFLQNTADNTDGTMRLAMTLLNPAPPVQGDGFLCQIRFKAVAAGRTTISIKDGLFGTRTGETIAPQFQESEISASGPSADSADVPSGSGERPIEIGSSADSQTSARASLSTWPVAVIVGLAAIVLVVAGGVTEFVVSRRRSTSAEE